MYAVIYNVVVVVILDRKKKFFLFYEIILFDEIIKIVKAIKRINLDKLDGIVEWFDDLLHNYQNITNISDRIINRLCVLLKRQIENLKSLM